MTKKTVEYDLKQAHRLLEKYESQILSPDPDYEHTCYVASPLQERIAKRLGPDIGELDKLNPRPDGLRLLQSIWTAIKGEMPPLCDE